MVTATHMKGQLHFGSREKRAIPVMTILQAGAAIGETLIKGINALVDAKTNPPEIKDSRKQNLNDGKSNNASIR